jgi:hypothetical protein
MTFKTLAAASLGALALVAPAQAVESLPRHKGGER